MGFLIRGFKNAFRNTIRTFSVIIILAISIGLALIMLMSYQTVQTKIESVKGSIGNTISISPAGVRGFEGGGEPLTSTQISALATIEHITSIQTSLSARLTPTTDTNLLSAIDPGTLGNRFNRPRQENNTSPNQNSQTQNFTLPIQATGISDKSLLTSGDTKIFSGEIFDPTQDSNNAVIGSELATKNSLTVGSTFTLYGSQFSVVGISDSGNKFGNSGLYLPLSTLQKLSSQTDQVSNATVQVNNVSNVTAVVSAIVTKLGADKADVTSNQDSATNALTPLENIKNVSFYSLIGSLIAGSVIMLLTMIMIVRERRREIGVLKAIGASNIGVVMQFVSESLVLTLLGGVVGIVGGIIFSNPVLNALVKNNATVDTAQKLGEGSGRGFARVAEIGGQFRGGVVNSLDNLHNSIGLEVILYGLLAAIAIAIIGSAIPAFFIAKIKPAEVMRGE